MCTALSSSETGWDKNVLDRQEFDKKRLLCFQQQKAAVDDVNPADDPNNQGEDEFEEAEQEREETLPEEDKPLKPHDQKQENPEVEEHLVVSVCRRQNRLRTGGPDN